MLDRLALAPASCRRGGPVEARPADIGGGPNTKIDLKFINILWAIHECYSSMTYNL